MTDPMSLLGTTSDIDSLRLQLIAGSVQVQQQLTSRLAELGDGGLEVLMEFLLQQRDAFGSPIGASPAMSMAGKIYQVLYNCDSPVAKEFLQSHFPEGIVPLKSDAGIDYRPLQHLLAIQDLQPADSMTLQKMCELAGGTAVQRKWLYFTDIENFPITDLQTINNLWLVHSEGKFGFSVQRDIWVAGSKNWDNLWVKIGWRRGNSWTRYPQEFTWNLDAPKGHLPLSNQLRGVRVIASLLSHRAWSTSSSN